MKKATKLMAIAAALVAIFFTTNANAQAVKPDGWRLGIGLDGGLPTGNAHDVSKFELGGTARLQYGVNNSLALTLTSGYYNFFGKSFTSQVTSGTTVVTTTGKFKSFGMVPVKGGIKAFFTPSFYFGAEAGVGFETSPYGAIDGIPGTGSKDAKLLLSPGIGFASKSWEVSARYENFSGQGTNYGLAALRVAYGFGL